MSGLLFGKSRPGGQCGRPRQGVGGTASLQAGLSPCEAAWKTQGEHVRQILMPTAFHSLITFPVLIASSCFLEPSSALFLECISPPPHPLFTVFLFSKSLSFRRCDGVWGEEALENYAGGFYVCDGGIDHLVADISSPFFPFLYMSLLFGPQGTHYMNIFSV